MHCNIHEHVYVVRMGPSDVQVHVHQYFADYIAIFTLNAQAFTVGSVDDPDVGTVPVLLLRSASLTRLTVIVQTNASL